MGKPNIPEIIEALDTVINVYSDVATTKQSLDKVVTVYDAQWQIAKKLFPNRSDIELLKIGKVSLARLALMGPTELSSHRQELIVKARRLKEIFNQVNNEKNHLEQSENVTNSTTSYQILKNLEQKIRDFLEQELTQINSKWWKQLIPGDVKENAERRKKNDETRKTWHFQEQPLISYIDFTDYEKIIVRNDNWNDLFKYVFHDKTAISAKLKEIEPIRNTISHTRNLDDHEEKQLRFYSEEIIRAISYYHDNKEKIHKLIAQEKLEKEIPAVPISVSFDRTVYPVSSTVYMRANIPTLIKGKPIIFQVYNSQNKLLLTKQINPETYKDQELKSAGLYQTSFRMESDDFRVGEIFTVKTIYGNSEAADSSFIDARNPVVQSDKSVYLWGTDMLLTVIDPDADKDSQKPEFVGDRDDSKLIVKSSQGELVDYRLRETGDSTGIFQGLIGFIGKRNNGDIVPYSYKGGSFTKTQGKEVEDGFIVVSEYDELKITYTNSKGTAELTAFIIQNTESSPIGF